MSVSGPSPDPTLHHPVPCQGVEFNKHWTIISALRTAHLPFLCIEQDHCSRFPDGRGFSGHAKCQVRSHSWITSFPSLNYEITGSIEQPIFFFFSILAPYPYYITMACSLACSYLERNFITITLLEWVNPLRWKVLESLAIIRVTTSLIY